MFSLPLGSGQTLSAVLIVPAIVTILIALLIASLLVPGAKPEAAGKAIAYHIFKAVGVILLIMSGMQFLFSVFVSSFPETKTLFSLLLFFVIGIGLLIQGSRMIARIDAASAIVCRTVFTYSCIIIGLLSALSGLLSITVNFILTQSVQEWQSPVTIVLTGTVLALFSSYASGKKGKSAPRKK